MSSESQLPGVTVGIAKAQPDYSRSTVSRNPNTPCGNINIPELSAPETPTFFETLV